MAAIPTCFAIKKNKNIIKIRLLSYHLQVLNKVMVSSKTVKDNYYFNCLRGLCIEIVLIRFLWVYGLSYLCYEEYVLLNYGDT
jgi:hypothetical protein